MNRLPEDERQRIAAILKAGFGIRATAAMSGHAEVTIERHARNLGIKYVRNKAKRNRGNYPKEYMERQTLKWSQREFLKERIRGNIALWLAKNPKPQSVDQIWSAMKPQFPNLVRNSVIQMLRANAWGNYSEDSKGLWTYKLSGYYHPVVGFDVGKKDKYPEQKAAFYTYCRLRGIEDKLTDSMIEKLKQDNRKFIEETHRNAIKKMRPQLQLMATAFAIGETNDNQNRS